MGKFGLAGKALAIRVLPCGNLLLQGFKNGPMLGYTASLQTSKATCNIRYIDILTNDSLAL